MGTTGGGGVGTRGGGGVGTTGGGGVGTTGGGGVGNTRGMDGDGDGTTTEEGDYMGALWVLVAGGGMDVDPTMPGILRT